MSQIALYGKGGIGKSTIAANVAAAMGALGKRVLQVGCDPKHDSTRLLLHGASPPTVLDYIRDAPPGEHAADDIVRVGAFGVHCVEAGGPEPGVGCAGRGILTTFELLERLGVFGRDWDVILYDVLGDVVCGGFAVPIRNEYADRVYIVTSGEFMSIYAANNILRGMQNYEAEAGRVGGLVFNARGGSGELERVERFAEAAGLPIVAALPRDETFAASERAMRCIVEHTPGSALAETLRALAERMCDDSAMCHARPLGDRALEECVLEGRRPPTSFTPAPKRAAPAPTCEVPAPTCEVPAHTDSSDAYADNSNGASGGDVFRAAPAPPASSPLVSKSVAAKEPLHGCAFNGVLSITTQLADCLSVAHGPQSCAHIAFQTITSLSRRHLLERGTVLPMLTAPPIFSTDMSEAVMVFGGSDKLRARVEQAVACRPPAVFVVSTCPSGIIGEDIEATRALGNDQTRVIPLAADGNLTGDHLQGIFLAYQHIAEELIERGVSTEPDLVNIVAEKTIANATEGNLDFVTEVLVQLGLRVNCRFICETSYEQLRGFMKAPLNLLANEDYMGRGLRDYLQEEFGAVFFDKAMPIGFAESQAWVAELAARYGREDAVSGIVETFQRRYDALVEQLRPILEGRRLMIVTFNHNIDWILSTALDLGMQIAYVGILAYSQENRFVSRFIDQIQVLQTELEFDALERTAEVRDIDPDVLISNYLFSDDLTGVVMDTIPLCPDAGFLSGIYRASRWADMMRIDIEEGWRRDGDLYRKHLS
ncbi:MAG: AAA family ATPase [Coriobacteriales bacterium]|jgi:nitrogenase iron protein|nr:AAA family ATPase [Coriobacteriales bacterium]